MARHYIPWTDTVWSLALLILMTWLVLPVLGGSH